MPRLQAKIHLALNILSFKVIFMLKKAKLKMQKQPTRSPLPTVGSSVMRAVMKPLLFNEKRNVNEDTTESMWEIQAFLALILLPF